MKKVAVVIVAYYAEATIQDVIERIPKDDLIDEIIVVDDGSTDGTSQIAEKLGVEVIWQENRGYGGSQKTGYLKAIEDGADVVVLLHGDAQYFPEYIPELLQPIFGEKADVVFGSRIMKNPLGGGMPYYKYLGNKFLTFVENLVLKLGLTEYHCGYRVYTTNALKNVNFEMNSDKYVFDTEIIVQLKAKGFKIIEVPIDTHYDKDSLEISSFNSFIYGVEIFKTLAKYSLHESGIKKYKQFD